MRSKAALPQAGHRVPLRPLIPVLSKLKALFSQQRKKERIQWPDSQPGTERAKKRPPVKTGDPSGTCVPPSSEVCAGYQSDVIVRGVSRNPSELRGLCRSKLCLKTCNISRNPSELRGLCRSILWKAPSVKALRGHFVPGGGHKAPGRSPCPEMPPKQYITR